MSKTLNMTAGEAIVRFLDNQYVSFDGKENKFVDGVFAIFGHGCVVGIGEALAMTKHNLKVYMGKNEQGMAHAAIAYAKMNNRRKIIPCISSIGPGAANMITAAATATANNIPLLLLAGDTYASRQPDPVLQQIEQTYDLSITTNDAFKSVCRYFDRITRPELVMTAMLNAMRVLLDPAHTGGVAIAMPQDVQGEVFDYPEEFFKKRVHKIKRIKASEEDIEEASKFIKNSTRPLVIVGGGARYSEAGTEIKNFCKKHNIPLCETQAGKTTLEGNFELNLGGLGVTGNSCANDIAKISDLVIALGTRFTDFTTSSKTFFADKQVVSINMSPFHGAKLEAFSLVGDVKATLEEVDKYLDNYTTSFTGEVEKAKLCWANEMRRLCSIDLNRKDYVPEIKDMVDDAILGFIESYNGAIAQTTAIGIIRDELDKNAVIVGSAGSLPGDLQRMWTSDELYSYNMEYGYSCMGYEIAGALGSKMACMEKEVYAMVGDGSYLMLHSEMVTAIQEGIKINILLFDNAAFGCINNLQMGQGISSLCTERRFRNGNNPIEKGKFVKIDFAMNAKSYGFKTYTVKNEEELRAAIIDSKKQTVSTLIDIKTPPKTMTDGYGGWWRVGSTDLPRNKRQDEQKQERATKLKIARKY